MSDRLFNKISNALEVEISVKIFGRLVFHKIWPPVNSKN